MNRYMIRVGLLGILGVGPLLGTAAPAEGGQSGYVVAHSTHAEPQDEQAPEKRVHVYRFGSMVGRGYIGVDVISLTPELRSHFGVPEDSGVLVSRVREGGPAESAGIRVGDIVTAVDGERVESTNELARLVRRKDDGELLSVELYRDGALESYPVTVSERDRPFMDFSSGYAFLPGLDGDAVLTTDSPLLDEASRQAMEDAMRELGERFDGDEFRSRIRRLQELDFGEIQDRMREVEKRLKELEAELAREKEGRDEL